MPRFSDARFWGPLTLFWSVVALGCTGAPPTGSEADQPPPGALRGELTFDIARFDDDTSLRQYYLKVPGQAREPRLLFDAEPALEPGIVLDVWTTPEGDALRVRRFERAPAAPVQAVTRGLIGDTPNRARTFAFVLVDLGGGVNITAEQATAKLFGLTAGNTPSVRQYFIEASYGKQDVGGKVFGPLPYQMTGCDTRGMATALRPMIEGTYDHYLWYLGSRQAACSWSGLASGGSPQRPSRDTWYNASSGCVVLVQEPGHNFGMRHSSFMKCPDGPFADVPMGACTHNEYGDSYDPMGRGCRHMNGTQKAYLGWFGKCNVVDVGGSGTFTLVPLELPCDGTQVLQIKMPKSRPFQSSGGGGGTQVTQITHYFLELRAPVGIDRSIMPVVQVRVSGDTREGNTQSLHSWFLDMNPATPNLDGLVAGGSYTDPAGGVTFTVMAVDGNHAEVKVETAAGAEASTCLDGSPFTAPGPGRESCAAAPSVPGEAPVPLPDGGAGGGGVVPPRDAGAPSGGGPQIDAARPAPAGPQTGPVATPPPAPSPPASGAAAVEVDGGCGCTVGGSGGKGAATALVGLLLLLGALARRRGGWWLMGRRGRRPRHVG